MHKLMVVIVLLAAFAVFGSTAVLADSPTWTVVSVDTIGCDSGNTGFTMELAGVTDPNNLHWQTLVDAGGDRYMDEVIPGLTEADNGSYSWHLYDDNTGGTVTAAFPLPNDTPITVQLLLVDGSGGQIVSGSIVTFDRCNEGSVVSIEVLGASSGACTNPLPTNAVIHNLPQGAPAFYAADLSSQTGFAIPAGDWYVTQTSGDFSQLWIACQANNVWVPSNAVAP